jgi:4-aminobutyrate aminotransferase
LGAAFTYVGLRANVLEFMPPLTLTEDEVAEGIDIIDRAMSDVAAGKVSDADVAPFMMW